MTVTGLQLPGTVGGGMYASGRKYDLAIDWERPVSSWTSSELQEARDRAVGTTMSRMMSTPEGTRWRCEIPLPKGLAAAVAVSSGNIKKGEDEEVNSNGSESESGDDSHSAPNSEDSASLSAIADIGVTLLKPLHGVCLRKPEGWWTYEVCMGKHIRQYHAERQSDPDGEEGAYINVEVSEFVLGKFDSEVGTEAVPPSLLQQFGNGTPCDLTNKPRRAKLEILCQPNGKYNSFIEEIQEVATCEYHVKVRTPLLCKNAAFIDAASIEAVAPASPTNTITCTPLEEVDRASNVFFTDSGKVYTEQGEVGVDEADPVSSGGASPTEIDLLAAVQELLNSAGATED
jgi:hypothetical protein